jgi:hypothetical protein
MLYQINKHTTTWKWMAVRLRKQNRERLCLSCFACFKLSNVALNWLIHYFYWYGSLIIIRVEFTVIYHFSQFFIDLSTG